MTPDNLALLEQEIWRDVVGYENCYQVSNFGRVMSLPRLIPRREHLFTIKEKILKTIVSKRGYDQVTLSKDGLAVPKQVHRLVARAFLGELPKGYHTHHKDDNRRNNRLNNLEYLKKGRHMSLTNSGMKAPATKLTPFLVKLIRIRLNRGEAARKLAREYGVAQYTIRSIKKGLTWQSVT